MRLERLPQVPGSTSELKDKGNSADGTGAFVGSDK